MLHENCTRKCRALGELGKNGTDKGMSTVLLSQHSWQSGIGARMGTALPWSSRDSGNVLRGSPQAGTVPPAVAQPGGTGGADTPPMQTGSKFRACPGE